MLTTQVGDPPNHVKGELTKRGYTYRKLAEELDVRPETIWMIINGRTVSKRIIDHINSVLSQPLHTN